MRRVELPLENVVLRKHSRFKDREMQVSYLQGRSDEPRKVCCLRHPGKKDQGRNSDIQSADGKRHDAAFNRGRAASRALSAIWNGVSGTYGGSEDTRGDHSNELNHYDRVYRYSTLPFLSPRPKTSSRPPVSYLQYRQLRRPGWSLLTSLARLARQPN